MLESTSCEKGGPPSYAGEGARGRKRYGAKASPSSPRARNAVVVNVRSSRFAGPMSRNQIVRKVGSLLFVVETELPPSDGEWTEFLDLLRKSELAKTKILVVTAGGTPSPVQRKQLADALGGVRFRVAVVSDNISARFVASTIALFHRDHRSFSATEIGEAYDHLQLTPQERTIADSNVREMRALLA